MHASRSWSRPVVVTALATAVVLLASAFTTARSSSWDKRVLPMVNFDTKYHKVPYKHPVPIQFLTDKAFRKAVTTDVTKLSASDKRDLQNATALLRAFGLIKPNVNLLKAENALQGSSVLAFYDPDKQVVKVRGTKLNVDKDVTLAHELTHALQDQNFNLKRLEDQARKQHRSDSLQALIEGDAVNTQDAYLASLSKADQNAYDKASQADAPSPSALKDVPDFLQISEESPYDLGPIFVSVLRDSGGEQKVNAAFTRPPTDTSQLIYPERYLAKQNAAKVANPPVPKGAKVVDHDTFGYLDLFLLLATHADAHAAFDAAKGWDGDSLVTYKEAGSSRLCSRSEFHGRTPAATKTLSDALTAWAGTAPAGSATVAALKNGNVLLTSCDPGTAAQAPSNSLPQAYSIPVVRAALFGDLLKQKIPPAAAGCITDKVIDGTSLADINDPNHASWNVPSFATTVQDYARTCIATG
ncbi:MAG: hypothetical protein JWL73_3894 [Actinomycetia bacterium]|nr:hypothetical protein [Actinomycetes bacterium]